MTPQQLAILGNLLSVLKLMSGWPFGLLVFMTVVGPWVMALVLAYTQKRRFESVVSMYENNVDLAKSNQAMAQDLKDVVILNTTTITRLVDRIDAREGRNRI